MNEPHAVQTQAPERFPRVLLLAIGSLMVVTFALAAASRIQSGGASGVAELERLEASKSPIVLQRSLRFEDRPDGSIAVIDASNGQQIETVKPGADNFLRGTLRGLARERRRESIGAEPPFTLTAQANGYLVLTDPTTARSINLGSFGPTNAEVFARLLMAKGHDTLAATTSNPTSITP